MLNDIRAILFDLDGTLIDSYDLILSSFRYATKKVLGRVIPDEDLMQKVGQPLVVQMWDFADDETTHQLLVDTYRSHNHRVHDERLKPFPGVKETLEALSAANYPMGIVTSKRHALAKRGLEVCGIDGFFRFIVSPDDFPAHKPDPGPVIYGCELLGQEPAACLYVGDSPFDMRSGRDAGCKTAAALWGMFPESTLQTCAPDAALSTIEELPAMLTCS